MYTKHYGGQEGLAKDIHALSTKQKSELEQRKAPRNLFSNKTSKEALQKLSEDAQLDPEKRARIQDDLDMIQSLENVRISSDFTAAHQTLAGIPDVKNTYSKDIIDEQLKQLPQAQRRRVRSIITRAVNAIKEQHQGDGAPVIRISDLQKVIEHGSPETANAKKLHGSKDYEQYATINLTPKQTQRLQDFINQNTPLLLQHLSQEELDNAWNDAETLIFLIGISNDIHYQSA